MSLPALTEVYQNPLHLIQAQLIIPPIIKPGRACGLVVGHLLATPLRGSAHTLKYSLYYGKDNKRLVGYDNERGKGDHRHIEGEQERYVFTSVEQLIADFLAAVRGMRVEL